MAWGGAGAGGSKKRSDDKIWDVFGNLFYTRFWDHGKCSSCQREVNGIFGPKGLHDRFYCRKCWIDYLRSADDSEWKEWEAWKPQTRASPSQSSRDHEIKCALLSISQVGGSITFPADLSAWDRQRVHAFCEQEPELACFKKASYGEGDRRFIRVSTKAGGEAATLEEACAYLEAADKDLDSMSQESLEALQQKMEEGLRLVQQKLVQQKLATLTLGGTESGDQPKNVACKTEEDQAMQESTPAPKPPPRPPVKPPSKASAPDKGDAQKSSKEDAEAPPKVAPKPKASPKAEKTKGTENGAQNEKSTNGEANSAGAKREPNNASQVKQDTVAAVTADDDFPALGAAPKDDFPALGAAPKKGGKKKK